MEEKKERYFYRIGDDFTLMDGNGFVAHESYMCLNKSIGTYFLEAPIIEKINANEEGFFDFSKGMIDIGCEIGEYSQWTNFSYYHMFDGNKGKLIVADFNMFIRGRSNICESHVALLSNKAEEVEYDGFNVEQENEDGRFDHSTARKVSTTTIDTFGIENVGFIKVDVEGMEERVLRGAVGTIIRNNYPPILFEAWDVGVGGMTQEKHNSLENFIRGLGYEILWYWGDGQTHLAVRR